MAKKAKVTRAKYIRGGKVPSSNQVAPSSFMSAAMMGSTAVPTTDPTGARPFTGTASVPVTPFVGTESLAQQLDVVEMAERANIYDPSIGYGQAKVDENGMFKETGVEAVKRIKKVKRKK